MDSSIPSYSVADGDDAPVARNKARTESLSQKSDDSQTAADFIRDQMQLEADAREALPYSIENCTKPLGPLRQSAFACLTCNPPPANPSDPYNGAGVCYACSVQCHGEHTLVEIFTKRNFTCDCGTTRFPDTSPCNLRINPETNTKGGVYSEEPNPNNKYNQNFRNRFCGCECDYDPFQQKGTMFQCLGLGTHETGGCGEDWWHPGCVVGLGPRWFEKTAKQKIKSEATETDGPLPTITEDTQAADENGDTWAGEAEDDDPPPPPGFPAEDEFESFLCYKCVEAHPWIKRYAGTPGFLAPVYLRQGEGPGQESAPAAAPAGPNGESNGDSKKRKAEDDEADSQTSKRFRSEVDAVEPAEVSSSISTTSITATTVETSKVDATSVCKLTTLPASPPQTNTSPFSLFLTSDFRDRLCHCTSCFPLLAPHPQLLEEEETYEPPVSDDGDGASISNGGSSLYDRGESALRNVDRVRAIEGVMAYQHLKDKLMPFFQQFAESKQVISAEDVKEYFAKLRGDDEAIKEAGERVGREGGGGRGEGDGSGDTRREESGY
ncbi:putative zinc finger in N-recognin-domain-containing protein [Corynascus novoguineensis]|uniref:Zinc finger in N-recognin-domain-containing protein n=1 Tax=Corynascus novoguineensis TaxID=1126955 RepID=A0AAN7CVE9_9PEZI|nr:putative zinc finger in N-recognin-domain-containing protein [Corynascus novoguineensis]